MKATLRKNGSSMITVRTTHQVSGDDFVYALAYHHGLTGGDLSQVTKAQAEEALRDILHQRGIEDLWAVSEEFGGMELIKKASQLVRRLFPEMDLEQTA